MSLSKWLLGQLRPTGLPMAGLRRAWVTQIGQGTDLPSVRKWPIEYEDVFPDLGVCIEIHRGNAWLVDT